MNNLGFVTRKNKTVPNFKLALSELFARVAPESGDHELLDVAEQGRVLVNEFVDIDAELNIESFVKFLLAEWPNQKIRNTVKTFVLEIMTTDLVDGDMVTDSNNRDNAGGPGEGDELIDAIISMYEERLSRSQLGQEMQKLRKEYEVEDPERLKEELRRLLPADAAIFINFIAASFIEESEARTHELRYWSLQLPEESTAPKAPAAERNKVKMLVTKAADKLVRKIRETKNPGSVEAINNITSAVEETVKTDLPVKPIFATNLAAVELFEKIFETLQKGHADYSRSDLIYMMVRICGSRLFESERVRAEKFERCMEELHRLLQENTPYRKLHDFIWNTSNSTYNTQTEAYTMVDRIVNLVRALRPTNPSPDQIEDLIEDCRRVKNPHVQRLFKGIINQWSKLIRSYAIQWGVKANVLLPHEPPGYVPPKTPFIPFTKSSYTSPSATATAVRQHDNADSGNSSDENSPDEDYHHPGTASAAGASITHEPSPLPTPKTLTRQQPQSQLQPQPQPQPSAPAQVGPAPGLKIVTASPAPPIKPSPLVASAAPAQTAPVAAPVPAVAIGSLAQYVKSWEGWCGRPLSLFELQGFRKFLQSQEPSMRLQVAQALKPLGGYEGFAADVALLVSGEGRRTAKHQQLKREAKARLSSNVQSPFHCSPAATNTTPVRPSGLQMERDTGNLAELYQVLLCTFARHFLGVRVLDATVVQEISEHFGISVLQEMWALRFSFVAAATVWRKLSANCPGSAAVSESEMRAASQTFVSHLRRAGTLVSADALTGGAADLFFSGASQPTLELPGILLDCLEVTSDSKTTFVGDLCGLLARTENPQEVAHVARILASDHGLLVTDEDSFLAFLEILVLNCASSSFEQLREALHRGLVHVSNSL